MIHYTVKTIKGRKYVYSQQTIDGKQKEKYLGSYDKPELQALISQNGETKITKITQSIENLDIYKKQTLEKLRAIKSAYGSGSGFDNLLLWEKELEEEVAETDKTLR